MSSDRVSMLSVYGSADTGILGVESFPLIKVRQFLSQNPTVAREVGFTSGVIPNLYHAQTDGNFLEIVDKELVVTKWQGIPLVRYNLEDHVQIFSWSGLCHKISSVDSKNSATWQALEQLELPDVLAVSGRSQGCLFLCGSNIFESMLQEVILQSSFRERFTGNFVVWTSVISGQQQLHWQIEFKRQALLPTEEEVATMQSEFVSLLSIQQPEFGEDYEKFYRPAEVLGLPIFQFHFSTFPYLENHPRFASATKRTVVLDQGPL
jgi:phenylacetate-CoA ligase